MKTPCLSLFFLCFLLVCSNLQGQTIIESRIVNSENDPLPSASAILLTMQDSVMVGFALADDQGRIRIENIKSGSYLVHTSFLGYLDEYIAVKIDESERKLDLPDIVMNTAFAPPQIRISITGHGRSWKIRLNPTEVQTKIHA